MILFLDTSTADMN